MFSAVDVEYYGVCINCVPRRTGKTKGPPRRAFFLILTVAVYPSEMTTKAVMCETALFDGAMEDVHADRHSI